MKPNGYNHITLHLRNYTKISCVKRDISFLSIKKRDNVNNEIIYFIILYE